MAPLEMIGKVVSNAMQKSIVVAVKRGKVFKKYETSIMVTRRFMAHDEKEESKVGDMVKIKECRPLSRRKKFTLIDIVERDPYAPEGKVSLPYAQRR